MLELSEHSVRAQVRNIEVDVGSNVISATYIYAEPRRLKPGM